MNLLPFLIFKRLFFFTLCLLSLQAHALTLTLEERAWIEQNPTITLGSDSAWAPYDFVNKQNQHMGISADIIEIIRQKTRLNIQIKSGVWADIMIEMQAGRLDGLVCAVKTPEREAYLNFTPPYATMPLAIVTRINQTHIQSMEDLKGQTVGVNKGSYLHEWLKTNYPDIVLVLTNSNEQALDFVSFGQVDAYFGNVAVATYVIRQKYLTNLKIVAKVDGLETKTSIAIDKNQPILTAIMQKVLADIKPEATRVINEKWFFQSQLNDSDSVILTKKEQAWIRSHGTVNVASELDWPPFNFMDSTESSQKVKGLSIDLLKLIAQKTGLQLTLTADTWSNNLKSLKAKQTDVLPAGIKTEERAHFAIFSAPYFKASNYFFIRDDLLVESLKDLDGKVLALPKGFASIAFIKENYPNITVLETNSMQEAVEAVIQNKAQVLYGLYPVISYLLRKTAVNSIIPFKTTQLGARDLRFLLRKDAPELLSILNKGLAAVSEEEKAAIELKWYASSAFNKAKSISLTAQERTWMQANQVVKVSSEYDWPPFDFVEKNQRPIGLSIDYLTLVGNKTGLTFEITVDRWVANLSNLEHKQTDLLPAAFQTEHRKRFALFSDPYFKARYYFFIRDDLNFQSISDLNGKTVAVPKGFAQIIALQQFFPKINILETKSMQEAIEAVIQNKAQILYDVYPVLSYSLRKAGINTIVPFKATHQELQNVHFMVRNDAPELASILNKGLALITETERNLIESKWLVKRQNSEYEPDFELTQPERLWLQKNPSIRFTGDPDWLPFEAFDSEGRYSGIVADFLKVIEREIPLEFTPVPVATWLETLTLADNKMVDVISGDVDDAHLAQNYSPIEPYITVPIVMVMEGESEFVNTLSELKGKSLGIVKGYGYTHALLNKYEDYLFIEFDTPFELLESVLTGKMDVALLSLPVASYLIKQNAFYGLNVVGKTELGMQLTLFVSKEQPELHQLLNRVMKTVKEKQGGEILNTWIKLDFASKVDYWLIFQIISVALFFMGLIFYWNLKLSNEINQRKQAEKQLNVEKDKFKHLFDQAADGHLIFQRNQFVACNQAALMLLGLKNKAELLGLNVTNWSPEFQPDGEYSVTKCKQFIQKCFNEGVQRFDWMLKDVDGHSFWVDVVYTSIPYLGKPAIYISWRDKTEQKALEESLKQNEMQIKLLIDSIPLIVIVTNFEGQILNANRKAVDDYQVTPEKISNLNISSFYQHSSDRDEIKRRLASDGRVDQKIVTMKDFQGNAREMMLSVIPIKYHNQAALLTISVDLTERILAEKQLKEATAKAEAANRSKTEFLANMSHEIRTPMNAILGFTELLNEQVKEPRLKSFISTIQSAGNTLLMLINDILDLSKIEAGKMTIQNIATNPHELFKEVGDIFTMNIQKKGLDFYIEIDPDIPHSLLLDPVRLRQVLFNLLGNAVKFTETGSIKLSVQSLGVFDHLSKMNLLIKVEDTGIGIPLTQQDRIFNVFEQQEGQDSGKFGGTGLGLSITKRLVSMMKGSLSVESTLNQGSTFSILLEKIDIASVLSQHQLEQTLTFDARTIQFKTATILVVDDILDNRELICQNFIDSGIDVIQAENGQEAIEQYKKHDIDLILMDIRMPVLNGYEAAKVIKSLNPNMPIIALTASVMQDEFEKIKRDYFDDYLRKPVLRNDLIQTLAKFLEYRELKEEERKPVVDLSFEPSHFSEALLQVLYDKLEPLYRQAVSTNSIDDIKAFAKQVAKIASTHESEPLDYFATQLLEKVDSFDITGMQFLLKKYEAVVREKGTDL